MDSLITAAARALAAGDAFGALNRVALREDPPALALRGIAMAQIGEFAEARSLLRRAARAFGTDVPLAHARCVLAEAEIALASRDLAWPAQFLEQARSILERHGDRANAAHARHLEIRHLLLTGPLDDAERALAQFDASPLAPASRAAHELVAAGVAIRRLRTGAARVALARAKHAAGLARIRALTAEVENASLALESPAARLHSRGRERLLRLEQVEELLQSDALVIDTLRRALRHCGTVVSLARRPVLFALARALGEAWPSDVPRADLVSSAFRTREVDETHRARLRVEIGRLRTELRELADITATARGFELRPHGIGEVVLLTSPIAEKHAAVLALLADGELWSSSALALALGSSQRSVQRALDSLASEGKAQSFGRGRARRWTAPPVPGFTTHLLLPGPLPID
ncbi:MAG TPA: hypothetical protein VLT59_12360 [Steroidobacteraceae bacterium]|nr:hypothetical protein [Steroidobacteraceae bacterium]